MKTIVERNELIVNYMPLAHKIAWTFDVNQIDDIKSVAYLGLIDAADRFEEIKNIPFASYASYRIKGEILDFLRNQEKYVPLEEDSLV